MLLNQSPLQINVLICLIRQFEMKYKKQCKYVTKKLFEKHGRNVRDQT